MNAITWLRFFFHLRLLIFFEFFDNRLRNAPALVHQIKKFAQHRNIRFVSSERNNFLANVIHLLFLKIKRTEYVKTNLFLRNRIMAAVVPRMAAQDSFCSQIQSLRRSESLDRLISIFAASRMEPAAQRARVFARNPVIDRNGLLINPY